MNYSTDNTRIIDRKKVPAPYELVNKYPINDEISKLVYGTRNEISQILHDKDDRLFVVVGPCSIHDPESAIEYAKKLSVENKKFSENLLIIMRVYFEKPRTTVGWPVHSKRDTIGSIAPPSDWYRLPTTVARN